MLQRAKEELQKGLTLLADRQKRIKLADRSQYGWALVDEYEDDELALDDNDSKRIEKAEKAAATKACKRKKAANPCSGRQMQGPQPRTWEQPISQKPRERFPPRAEWALPPNATSRPLRVAGPCFQCGEIGHQWATCPKLTKSKLTKSYPFCNKECVDKPEREYTPS